MRTVAFLVFCVGLLVALPAAARRVALRIDRVELATGGLQDVQLDLDAKTAALRLALDAVDAAARPLGRAEASAALRHDAAGWQGQGSARWQGAARAALTAQLGFVIDAQQAALSLSHGDIGARLALPRTNGSLEANARVVLPLAPLQAWLGAEWPALVLRGGRVEIDARYDAQAARGRALTAQLQLADVAVESTSGAFAVAGLRGSGQVAADRRDGSWRLAPTLRLHGGEVLAGPFYARLPEADVRVAARLGAGADGTWAVEALQWDDPGTLSVELDARLDPRAAAPWRALDLRRVEAHLPAAYARYAQAFVATRGWGDLATRGILRGSLRWDERGPAAFSLQLEDVGVVDGGGRLAVEGARGALDWRREGELPATTLSWDGLRLYRVALGASRMTWRSRAGLLSLAAPAAAPLAGGLLELVRAEWRPDAERGERLNASLAVHDVDVATLSAALGWPAFRGTLGGAVPALRYADGRLVLDGGLLLQLFGGNVNVTDLALERPFGVAPSLAANVVLSGIDLQPLTAAFGFGDITGHLRGHIAGLRLLDWRPVAFDAELVADEGGTISQRAVTSLSSVGGSGLVAGLQGQMLRLFDTFGYRRIRLACRLVDDVCHMGGVDSAGDGYTLVEGRGLPRIAIVGHQREVDWPTLVQRLRDATSGTPPILR